MIDGLLEDPSAVVFGATRELISELQYSNLEGYLSSDTLLVLV